MEGGGFLYSPILYLPILYSPILYSPVSYASHRYVIIFSAFVLVHSTSEVGGMLLTLRCVESKDKAMALGLISVAIGLLSECVCVCVCVCVLFSISIVYNHYNFPHHSSPFLITRLSPSLPPSLIPFPTPIPHSQASHLSLSPISFIPHPPSPSPSSPIPHHHSYPPPAPLPGTGNVPCPIIYGAVVDSACIQWKETCRRAGACQLYDSDAFRIFFHGK